MISTENYMNQEFNNIRKQMVLAVCAKETNIKISGIILKENRDKLERLGCIVEATPDFNTRISWSNIELADGEESK